MKRINLHIHSLSELVQASNTHMRSTGDMWIFKFMVVFLINCVFVRSCARKQAGINFVNKHPEKKEMS